MGAPVKNEFDKRMETFDLIVKRVTKIKNKTVFFLEPYQEILEQIDQISVELLQVAQFMKIEKQRLEDTIKQLEQKILELEKTVK